MPPKGKYSYPAASGSIVFSCIQEVIVAGKYMLKLTHLLAYTFPCQCTER